MTKLMETLLKIKIHPLFWVVIGISIITAHFKELLMLFLIVFIHELGHVTGAHFFSWRIKKIQLLPFGGVAEMDEHGNRPIKEELIVILAGPITHIVLVFIGYIFYAFSIISAETLDLFIFHNLVILFFNLLPIWPLDGGKLLLLLFSLKKPFSDAHKMTIQLSIIGVGLFILAVLYYSPSQLHLWMIITFLLFSIVMEWRQRHFVFMRFLLERYYGDASQIQRLTPLIVDEKETIQEVLVKFYRGNKHSIIISKKGKHHVPLDENEVLHAYFNERRTTEHVGDLIYPY
ncbi:M50 family metallopeptidase [Bacillus luteolus]|uniref:M50 family metallopeptidase n=1 Tax=Litchfieldia luteola TaxID=682179 RepID=A0ABR9QI10_9BACI|nr:M50 family metallopeptidase [Cytobacillus luteolus]MBE4908137.1 M50 family metallopeptidase [Cytobacillus luteolus]MBP1942922.1 stage IV sporulation protein FB [Cytobacillus luteolus]